MNASPSNTSLKLPPTVRLCAPVSACRFVFRSILSKTRPDQVRQIQLGRRPTAVKVSQGFPCRPVPQTQDPKSKPRKEGQTRSRSVKPGQARSGSVKPSQGQSRSSLPNRRHPRPAPHAPSLAPSRVKPSQGCRQAPRTQDPKSKTRKEGQTRSRSVKPGQGQQDYESLPRQKRTPHRQPVGAREPRGDQPWRQAPEPANQATNQAKIPRKQG